MRGNLVRAGRFTVTGDVGVLACPFVAAPRMIGAGDLVEVGIGQLAMHTVDKRAKFAGIDE
jgi:hypothetical protein